MAYAFLHTLHIECQSCDKPLAVDNTKDTVRVATTKPIQPSALCSWLLRRRCCYTNMGDWWDHLLSRSCSDTTYNERTSSLKSCRSRFLCNLVQKRTSLFGSILLDKTLGNIYKYETRCQYNCTEIKIILLVLTDTEVELLSWNSPYLSILVHQELSVSLSCTLSPFLELR